MNLPPPDWADIPKEMRPDTDARVNTLESDLRSSALPAQQAVQRALSGVAPAARPFVVYHAAYKLAERHYPPIECESLFSEAQDRSLVHAAYQRHAADQGRGHLQIPGYQLNEERGRGGQAIVYKVNHAQHGEFAVKTLLPRFRDSPVDIERFRREARYVKNLAALKHPNIVQVVEIADERAPVPYIVMELLPGPTLDVFVDQHNLNIRQVVGLIKTVAAAVGDVARKGFIHRDLKPSNVLMNANNEPVLLDFGFAKRGAGAEGDDTQSASLTETGQFMGSYRWISPEHLSSNGSELDTRSDVYSLGVILYSLLTNKEAPYPNSRAPLDNLHLGDLRINAYFHSVLSDERMSPRQFNTQIDRHLETIVLKCIERDPRRRYDNAGALAEDLERYLSGLPIRAKQDSQLRKLQKRLNRNRALLATSICVGAAMLVSLALVWRAWNSEAEAKRSAETAALAAKQSEREAIAAREESERRLTVARAAADAMLRGICDELPKLAGGTAPGFRLLQDAERICTELTDSSDQPSDRQRAASANQRLAHAYLEMGRIEDASRALSRAITIVDELRRNDPNRPSYVQNSASLEISLARCLTRAAKLADARAHLETAIDLLDRLLQEPSASDALKADARGNLVIALGELGTLCMELADTRAARKFLQQAYDIAITEPPTNTQGRPSSLYNAWSAQARLSDIAWDTGDLAGAKASLDEMLRLAKELNDAQPNNRRYQQALAFTHERRGLRATSLNEAEAEYKKSREFVELLAAADPDVAAYQDDLAMCHQNLARFAKAAGDLDATREHLGRMAGIFDRLAAAEPDNTRYKHMLVVAHVNFADAIRELEGPEFAQPFYENALNGSLRLLAAAPSNVEYQRALLGAHLRLAALGLTVLTAGEVAEHWRQAVQIVNELSTRSDVPNEQLYELAITLLVDIPASSTSYETAHAIADRLSTDHTSPEWTIAAIKAAECFFNGNIEEAVECQEVAMQLLPGSNIERRTTLLSKLEKYRAAAKVPPAP